MQFKDLGSLFDGFGELNFKHASKASSFADLDGIDKNTIKGLFKIDSNDISDFTMAQIQAKASTMGLTESLTDELMAMSKDADFTAKAKVGKVTWGEALKEGSTNADQIGKALMKSSDVSDKAKKKLSEVYDKFGSGSQVYQKQLENIINGANGLDDISGKFTTLGADVQKSTGMFESAGNIIKGFFASIKGYIPILAVAGTAFAAFKLWDYSQTRYTRAKEKAETSASTFSEDKSNLQSLQQELDATKSKIEELNATKEQNGGLSLTDEAELSRLEQENAQLERKVAIQKQLTEISAQAASSDAQKAANTAQTYWDHLKEQNGGGFFGALKSIPQYFGAKRVEKDGKVSIIKDKDTWEKENGGKGNTTLENQTKANIKTLKDYQSQLKDIETQLGSSDLTKGERKSLQKQQKELSENIANTKQTLSTQTDQLQQWIDASYGADGKLESGASKYVDNWNKIINNVNNTIGQKTKTQIDASNLDTYFNSSSGSAMKEYLENIVEEGGSAQDALDAFRESGMRLKDINVSENGFLTYFEDVKRQAEEAKQAAEDYSASVSDVESATESANQDKDWSTLIDQAKSAGDGNWTTEDLLKLDSEGLLVDGKKISNMIADVGDTAKETGEKMHDIDSSLYSEEYAKYWDEISAKAEKANMSVEDYVNTVASTSVTSDNLVTKDNGFDKVVENAKNAVETLKGLGNENLKLDFDFKTTNLTDIENQIQQAKSNLDQFKNDDGTDNNYYGDVMIINQGLNSDIIEGDPQLIYYPPKFKLWRGGAATENVYGHPQFTFFLIGRGKVC